MPKGNTKHWPTWLTKILKNIQNLDISHFCFVECGYDMSKLEHRDCFAHLIFFNDVLLGVAVIVFLSSLMKHLYITVYVLTPFSQLLEDSFTAFSNKY